MNIIHTKSGGLGIGGVAPKVEIKSSSLYNLKGQQLPLENLKSRSAGITISNSNIKKEYQKSIITK